MNFINKYLYPKSKEELESHFDEFDVNNLLILSSYYGYVRGMKYAINNGADVNLYNGLPLVYCATDGYLNAIKLLVESDVDVHENDSDALVLAAMSEYKDVVQYLIKNGAEIDNEDIDDFVHNKDISQDMADFLRSQINS